MKSLNWKWILVGVLAVVLALTLACGRKSEVEKAYDLAKSVSESMAPTSAQNDYLKPYLTDDKMAKFIASMKEEMNPFEAIFTGGQGQSISDITERVEEYNTFAKKYGFADYADYISVWGRITVGQMVMAAEEMNKSSLEWMQKSVATAEENLKKPDLSPEMKTMYEEQLASSKKSLEDMQKPDASPKSLNDEDLALVLKYKAQLEEAAKKYKENQ